VRAPTPVPPDTRDAASPASHSIPGPLFNLIPSDRRYNIAPAPVELISNPIGTPPYAAGQHEAVLVDSSQRISDTSRHESRPKDPWRILDTRSGIYTEDGSESGTIDYETGLLLHYRYNVAPWIDVGDPESSFGTTVMLEAKEHRSLLEAVLALAACHRSLISLNSTDDIEMGLRHTIDAENGLQIVEEHISRITRTLLMIRDLFSSSLQHWRDILSRHLSRDKIALPDTGGKCDYDGPIFWLYFKIGEYSPEPPAQEYC
jgi:hypothetical protein